MTWGVLVLASLASYRLTRFVTADTITERAREWLLLRYPPRNEPLTDERGWAIDGTAHFVPHPLIAFVHCAWCVSVWTSAAVLLVAHSAGLLDSWQILVLAWLAVSTVVGFISRLED